jgi:nitroreductase
VVVTDAVRRGALAEACAGQEHVGQAPVVIVGCAEVSKYKDPDDQASHLLDVAIAMTQMTLQATAEGLGTCWITGFDERRVKETLKAPPAIRVVALIAMGHPNGRPRPFSRLPLEQIVHRETW